MLRLHDRQGVAWRLAVAMATLSASAAAQITFDTPISYYCGDEPGDIALGDYDADGDLDLATALRSPARLSVLRNLGDGTFDLPEFTNLASALDPAGLLALDFDADGLEDLAVTSSGTDQIVILHNLGDAHFAPVATLYVGDGPRELAAGDIDSDGDVDLAVSNQYGGTVAFVRNLSNTQFDLLGSFAVGMSPRALDFGHFVSDATLDLAVTSHDTHEVKVLRNDGTGHFKLMATLTCPMGGHPECVEVADFDGDRDEDLAVAFSQAMANKFSVFYQTAPGVFSAPSCFNVGALHPSHIVAADFDLDTRIDVAVVSSDTNVLSILRNLGNYYFGFQVLFSLPGPLSDHLAAGDLDRDHMLDLVVTNDGADMLSVALNSRTNPSNYCLTVPNSAGPGAVIGGSGPVSIAEGKFTLWVTGAPPEMNGLFLYGATPIHKTFQHGYQCIAMPLARLRPLVHVNSYGDANYMLHFTDPPLVSGPFAITPGSVWNFQFWYRDILAGGRQHTNLSDGLRVVFEP